MSQGFLENLEVSAIFFLLDLVLITILLPIILSMREKRRWAPLRKELLGHAAGLFFDCARSVGYQSNDSILHMYIELCLRTETAQSQRSVPLKMLPLQSSLFPQDLAPLAKMRYQKQKEAISNFERSVMIFSASIDADLAPHIAALLNAAGTIDLVVWQIANSIMMSEEGLFSDGPYSREADAYNSFAHIPDAYTALTSVASSVEEMCALIGSTKFDAASTRDALSQARERIEACRAAVLRLFKSLGLEPPKAALHSIN
jgi:hypothetical protein